MQRKGATELSFLKRAFWGELSWAAGLFLGRVKMLGGGLVWSCYVSCMAWAVGGGVLIVMGEGIGKKAIKKIYGLDRSYFVLCCD